MKKPYDFRELSDRVCRHAGCRRRIKKNVLDKNPEATLCYRHHMALVRKNPRYTKKHRAA